MNCCWILLLLLCCGRGGCGSAFSGTSNNCGCGRQETRNAGGRQERGPRNPGGRKETEARNAGRRNEQEPGCGCEDARQESRMENRDGCDVASTIPQPWQEYAKRDSDSCQD